MVEGGGGGHGKLVGRMPMEGGGGAVSVAKIHVQSGQAYDFG